MSRKVIEIVQVLVDRIEKGGYQQRAREDDIADVYKRLNEAEGQAKHWKQARQEAHEAGELMKAEIETLREQLRTAAGRVDLTAENNRSLRQQLDAALASLTGQRLNAEERDREIETLRGAMAADDKRLRAAEERVWPGETRGCDAPDSMADEILHLRHLRNVAEAEAVAVRKWLSEETDRHRKTNSEKIELFQQKESANQHNAELVKARDAAHMTILAQQRGNQYLRLLIDKVRAIAGRDDAMSERLEEIAMAIEEFDDGTLEPTPVAEPVPSSEVERLRAFVEIMRGLLTAEYADQRIIAAAIAKLDDAGNSSVTLTSSPTPVAETLDAEGGA